MRVMGDWKKGEAGYKFEVKLPPLDNSSKNGIVVKCEIPPLTKSTPQKRSPNYLPKLCNYPFNSGKRFLQKSSFLRLEQGGANKWDKVPQINDFGTNGKLRPGLRRYQQSWFTVFSMRCQQKRNWPANVAPSGTGATKKPRTSTLSNIRQRKHHFDDKPNTDNQNVTNDIDSNESSLTVTIEDSNAEAKDSEYELENRRASLKQMGVSTKLLMVSSDGRLEKNPPREKYWIPNEIRRKFTGP